MTDVIYRLRADLPAFHGTDDEPRNWKSQWGILEFIAETLTPASVSLETGCGYSTVVFASTGARHTTVTPSKEEPVRVRTYCERAGIDSSNVEFAIGPSCEVLPSGSGALDFVYIDGAHGFPHPCIDWMYTEGRLRVGGHMLVDDIRIPTCRILHDFLKEERNWQLSRFIGDTAIYIKTGESPDNAHWMTQRYNRGYPDFTFIPVWQRSLHSGRNMAETAARKLGLAGPLKKILKWKP